MQLVDVIRECDDGRPSPRATDAIEGVAIHRIWFDDWPLERLVHTSPVAIARRFIDDPEVSKYTGQELAYTFLLDVGGCWWQCLRLTDTGKHARRWSVPMIGVGVIGDFRKQPVPPSQRASLVEGLAELCSALGIHPMAPWLVQNLTVHRVAGHDELPEGSNDPDKRCPGAYLSMRDLRRDVALGMERQAMARLMAGSGVVL